LYPYAIPQLTRLSATAFCNETPDLETLFGQEGKALEECMMLAKDNGMRVKVLSRFLERKLLGTPSASGVTQAAIRHMMEGKGTLSVKKISEIFNLSTRQLERKVKEHAGFSPKLFSRLIRFHTALKEYGNKNLSLTEIAYACGYYDQSHFIQDFKAFSGYHPKAYFKGKAEGIEYREG
jgi:AraC-like DNA-binding protein